MNEDLDQLEFHPGVREQIRILHELFVAHSGKGLFDNDDVEFDRSRCSTNLLKFRVARRNSNSVELDFHLQSDGLRIDIDGYDEAWDCSLKRIEREAPEIRILLERLITTPILIEYKGGARFINLFHNDGTRYAIWSLQSFSALLLRGYWKSQLIDQHLFDPIYPPAK